MKDNNIIVFRTTNSNKILLENISKARGEDVSDFVRRAVFKELAELGFVSKEQRKALGMVNPSED